MDVTTALYDGCAGAIRQTMTMVRSQDHPGVVSEGERRGLQRLVEATAAMGSNMKRDMARAWEYLIAGQVDDPQREGKVLAWALETTRSLITEVEEGFREMQEKGWGRLELTSLELARKEMDREIARFRENWPMIAPERVEEARLRYAESGHPTFEEFAQQAGHDPAGAPRELPVPAWKHLVKRKHPWRRQLFLAGRNMTVRQLVNTVAVNGWSEDEAAKNVDLPVEAVREAFRYANENAKLLAAEADYEGLCLERRGQGRGTRAVPR